MKISILLKILKWLAKFGGHILLYHLILRSVGWRILYYKLKKGFYIEPVSVKKGYRIHPIIYKKEQEEDLELLFESLREDNTFLQEPPKDYY